MKACANKTTKVVNIKSLSWSNIKAWTGYFLLKSQHFACQNLTIVWLICEVEKGGVLALEWWYFQILSKMKIQPKYYSKHQPFFVTWNSIKGFKAAFQIFIKRFSTRTQSFIVTRRKMLQYEQQWWKEIFIDVDLENCFWSWNIEIVYLDILINRKCHQCSNIWHGNLGLK